MAEYIIDKGVSPEVWADIEKLGKELGKLPTLGAGANNSAEMDILTKKVSELEAKLKKLTETKREQLTIEQKVEQQAIRSQQKIDALANSTSKHIDVMARLTAQMKQQEQIMKQNYNPQIEKQNKLYTEAAAKHAVLQKQSVQTAQATGVMSRQMSSAYGGTFQLTQVMRELPNFAISARIGFMSLSNNLPMLIDSFKLLAEKVDETGKKLGAKGAWKEFGKSLLSLNTLMIVASTILVMYGEDIMNWVEAAIRGKNAALDFAMALGEINKEAGDALKTDIENIKKFSHDYKKAVTDGNKERISDLEKIGLKEYGLHKDRLKLISETTNGWKTAFAKYIQLAKDAYYNEAIIKRETDARMSAELSLSNAQNLFRATSNTKSVKGKVSTGLFGEKKFSWDDLVARANNGSLYEQSFEALAIYGVSQEIINELRNINAQNKILKSLPKLRDSYINKLNKQKGLKGGSYSPTATNIDAKKDFYDKARFDLVKQISMAEEKANKTAVDGTINGYLSRYDAAEKFYLLSDRLIQSDLETEKFKLKEEQRIALKSVESKRNANNKKKLTDEEKKQSEIDYFTAVETINQNYNLGIIEAEDKYNEELLDVKKKFVKTKLQIDLDAYADEVQLLKTSMDDKKRMIDLEEKRQQGELSKQTVGESFVSAFTGYKKSDVQSNLLIQFEANNQRLGQEQWYISNKLALAKKGSEEEKALLLESAEKQKEIKDNFDQYRIDSENELQKEIANLQTEALSTSLQAIEEIWNGFYQRYFQKLDDEKRKQSKIENEKLQEIQDKEDAKVLTKEEAEKEKLRTSAYYASIQEQLDKDKAEADRNKFFLEQAAALAKVWINFAIAESSVENLLALGTLTPLYLAVAGASTALIAAQTIPYFAEGGIMDKNGLAMLGDGGKKELAISPSGKFFISNDTPTMYNLEKGTQILPDVNKLDLMSILALKQVMPQNSSTNDGKLMRELINTVKSQKSGNFYGMPLIKQLDNRNRYSSRNKSLMN